MPGRPRDRSSGGGPDKEASARQRQATGGKAEADEKAHDSEGFAPYDVVPRDNTPRRTGPSGFRGRSGPRAGDYYDDTYRRDEGRRATGRFGERADYEYDEPGYDSRRHRYRTADESWYERASDAIASWFGDEEAERRRRIAEQRQQNRGKGPKGYRRSDKRIKEDVNDRLSDDYYVDASEIEVQAAQGLVTLTGTVRSRDEKRRAEALAESVSGVTDVENRLRVRDEPYEVARELEQSPLATTNLGQVDQETHISLLQTVREAIQEESVARGYVTARYRSLIDRKYLNGLSPGEENELEALELTLEEMDQPYYEAIGERLRTLIEQSRT